MKMSTATATAVATESVSAEDVARSRSALLALMKQQEQLEREIGALHENLAGVKNPSQLVDDQGFPRADIDVHSVAIMRQKIVLLQNDHKAVMRRIEKALPAHNALKRRFAELHPEQESGSSSGNGNSDSKQQQEQPQQQVEEQQKEEEPFMVVGAVEDGSPAQDAGLRVGDQILRFGSINKHNFSNEAMVKAVQHSKGQVLPVAIVRPSIGRVNINFVPREWSGRGLLGCRLNPISQ
eukprot:TRINITY_DN25147_c0_g2_i1.p1 TRINITY_DN25147_c0_g2~~TRINITY_DN25147_c0_g2_i1.p1  ORF type:complete len:238 (-),score=95.66 TRINITY_DN25147_c0_g2_i1:7-720(-)